MSKSLTALANSQRSFHSGQEVPQDAIRGGQEPSGEPLYVARAHVEVDGNAVRLQSSVIVHSVETDRIAFQAGLHPGKFGKYDSNTSCIDSCSNSLELALSMSPIAD